MTKTESLDIEGPAGRIEAVWTGAGAGREAALLCHPHPLYGGSMHDAVIGAIEEALLGQGIATLRFNFRGVGRSEGDHDRGIGEATDVVYLLRWVREERGIEHLTLAGYSFGGAVALTAALVPEVVLSRLVLVAPALGRHAPDTTQLPCPLILILGVEDRIANGVAVNAWAGSLTSPADVIMVPGADHFFNGALDVVVSELGGRLA